MSETKSAENSLRAEAKNYEAVQMLNTKINETVDKKRRTKKDDENQVTIRQVFKLTHPSWMPGPDQNFVGPGQSGLVRNSGPILFLVRSGGPEFRTDLNWSGPLVRNSGPTFIGPVRRSGIPDQQILVRSVGPEFRTSKFWSGPLVRNSGPDRLGPVKWSGFRSGIPDRTSFGPGWSGFPNVFGLKIHDLRKYPIFNLISNQKRKVNDH